MNTEEKLTAYALGELNGAEKEAFEKELNKSPELQLEVEAIREFSGELEAEFKNEELLSLEGSQRDKILQASKKKKFKLLPIFISAAAACLVVGYLVLPEISSSKVDAVKIEREIKQAEEDPIIVDQLFDDNKDREKAKKYTAEKGDTLSNVELPSELSISGKKNEISFTYEAGNVSHETIQGLIGAESESKDINRTGRRGRVLEAQKQLVVEEMESLSMSPSIRQAVEGNTERYGQYLENSFGLVKENPLTTFSIDVDTASYTNLRRKLIDGYFPHKDAVRIEEMINYFDYDYPQPEAGRPFSVNTEVATSPWSKGNKLVRIGLQGKDVKVDKRPSSNLVFLIDVSGSMSSSDKLPLLKEGFQKMVSQLNEKDRVGIVVYAGNAGVVLEPTICDQRGKDLIIGAIGRLNSGGSTNGAGGINEAYRLVQKNFIQGGTNRVILATDGDFNVGVSHDAGLIGLVKEKAKEKAYLTVLAFGQGNLNDRMMEEISNKGNGNYYYIDSAKESTKVLCEKISSTLVTIAKDVKIQVEFNPALVHSYRLIGYDNRKLKNEDFNNDKKDAGEIGAGHSVTAIYEIVPVGSANARPKVDGLKYQPKKVEELVKEANEFTDELLTVKLRYKSPEGGPSTLMKHPVKNKKTEFNDASKDFIFSSSVAAFGMLLKNSEYCGDATFSDVKKWISENQATKSDEARQELLKLVLHAIAFQKGK